MNALRGFSKCDSEQCCACANWSACVFDAVSRPRRCPNGTATVSCVVILCGRRHNCWRAFWANLPLAFHGFLPLKGCWQCERVPGSSLRGVSGLRNMTQSHGVIDSRRFERMYYRSLTTSATDCPASYLRGAEFSLLAINNSFFVFLISSLVTSMKF